MNGVVVLEGTRRSERPNRRTNSDKVYKIGKAVPVRAPAGPYMTYDYTNV